MRLQEGGGLLHARLELDPVGHAVGEQLGVGRVGRVGQAHGHDVRRLERVGQPLDFGAGGLAELDPAHLRGGSGRVDGIAGVVARHVQRAGRQVFLPVGDEHEEAAVGVVVAHDGGAVVRHHLDQLVRDAAQAIVLLHRAGAVGVDGDLGQVAVVVRVGHGLAAEHVLAVSLELRVGRDEGRVGLVLFAGEVRVPRRQARAAGDPQAVGRGHVDVVVLDQAQLAGGLVLVEREHRDRRGQHAVGAVAGLVARGVFELDHCEHGLALDAGDGRVGQRQQRRAVGRVGEELALLAGHRRVDDRLAVDVVVAARQDGAALAVRHPVAGDEEGLVGQLEVGAAVVVVADPQRRADGGGRHRGRCGQRGRGHAREGGRDVVAHRNRRGCGCRRCGGCRCRRIVVAAAAGGQQGGAAEWEQRRAEKLQRKATRRLGCIGI